jgi:AcrR family transcriptional regulator
VINQPQAPEEKGRPLWFDPTVGSPTDHRVTLSRERVVTEALDVIGTDGVDALSMRALAGRLGVVPGALYRHVHGKDQLHDLVLDAVLADVDCRIDHDQPWSEQLAALAERLRSALEEHPGIAGLLKTRAPLTPHSLALTEAFLTVLTAAGMSEDQTGRAFHLISDYVLGFALSDRTSPGEQRVQNAATRQQLHAFLRSLPPDRFPVLTSIGERVWVPDRDERFTINLRTLIDGLQVPRRAIRRRRSTDEAQPPVGQGLPF